MKDVLQKFQEKHLFVEPFPHIIIPNALQDSENKQLIQQLKYAETIALQQQGGKPSLSRYAIEQNIISEDRNLSALKTFNKIHSGREFGQKMLDIFEPFIESNLPNIPLDRVKDYAASDSTFIINNPPVAGSYSPRGPHLDTFSTMCTFLYYVRPDNQLKGGNLQFYKHRDRFRGFNRFSRVDTNYLPSRSIELYKEVPYENNMLTIFLNGVNSVHGVQPVELGSPSRYLFTGGCSYAEGCYNPRSYLAKNEVLKDVVGEFYQKLRFKLLGQKPYGK